MLPSIPSVAADGRAQLLWYPMATGARTGNLCSFIEQSMPKGLGPPTPPTSFCAGAVSRSGM